MIFEIFRAKFFDFVKKKDFLYLQIKDEYTNIFKNKIDISMKLSGTYACIKAVIF